MNLQNAHEIYEEHLLRVKEKLQQKLEDDSQDIRKILIKVKDRYFVESILGKEKKTHSHTTNSTMVDIQTEQQDFELVRM